MKDISIVTLSKQQRNPNEATNRFTAIQVKAVKAKAKASTVLCNR
jgi:hypothetical protein